ncbi:MAG: UvrD-helicase domain-containing protein, partial [Bacteroidales bacterium]|nr:UvrD-helicase domain-containing protein [Bacteroidales bacterium]
MIDFLNDLNQTQKEAVEYLDGPSLIVAGAGSGKTRVLTYKIAYLLKNGYNPSSILALTFTNKAAEEMKQRVNTLLGSNISNYLEMGTFHGIFYKILRQEAEAIGFNKNITIYDTSDSQSLIKTLIASLNLNDEYYKPNLMYGRISRCKNNLLTPHKYRMSNDLQIEDSKARIPKFVDLYEAYFKQCKMQNAMDFDDLLLYANILFRDSPDILDKYMNKFKFILVDEYQDTNMSQYILIKKLSTLNNKVCVVGDDAQSIYGFRGARIENILNFKKDFPKHKLFKLEQNYRSTQTIVNAANSVIKKNEKQISKNVFSENNTGSLIQIQKALTDSEEAIIVAKGINETILSNHLPYAEIAVLYRTNAQSRNLEEALRKTNIPYKIYGGLSFYSRQEIKNVLAYVKLSVNPSDNEAFKRIVNYPSRKIGKVTIEKLQDVATQNNISLWEVIETPNAFPQLNINAGTLNRLLMFRDLVNNLKANISEQTASEYLNYLIQETGIYADLKNDKSVESMNRMENVDELINAAKNFEEEMLKDEPDADVSISSYLENVSLLTDMDNEAEEDFNKVTLMTIHSAKGLEYDHVFLVGLEEELFPSAMSRDTQAELEEERRLFYVAITRARKFLTITYASSRFRFGNLIYPSPSRFISEIDRNFVNWAENENEHK